MTTVNLREAVAEAPVKSGNRWRVIVARPGKGSSGTYSAELLKRDAYKMLPPNAQAFINHDDTRNPKDMLGVYPEGGYWSEEDQAVVAELEVFSGWRDFVEEVGPHCGISLYALGERDEEGNITAFLEDAYNGADLVARPGLEGSGLAEKLYEARKASANLEDPPSERKETKMDKEEIEALVAKTVADTLTAFVSAQESKAEEAAEESNTVVEAVEAYDAAVKAIDEADLFEEQVLALRAEAKTGADITAKIEEAKAVKEAAIKHVTESAEQFTEGRIHGSNEGVKFGAWK